MRTFCFTGWAKKHLRENLRESLMFWMYFWESFKLVQWKFEVINYRTCIVACAK